MTDAEIRPVGLDRSDPTTELRRAYINTLDGLTMTLLGKTFGDGKTSADHLRWMAKEILTNIRTMPLDKMGRWVGFIQGVMAANGALDVDAERNRTRPFFKPDVNTTDHVADIHDPVRDARNSWEPGDPPLQTDADREREKMIAREAAADIQGNRGFLPGMAKS